MSRVGLGGEWQESGDWWPLRCRLEAQDEERRRAAIRAARAGSGIEGGASVKREVPDDWTAALDERDRLREELERLRAILRMTEDERIFSLEAELTRLRYELERLRGIRANDDR